MIRTTLIRKGTAATTLRRRSINNNISKHPSSISCTRLSSNNAVIASATTTTISSNYNIRQNSQPSQHRQPPQRSHHYLSSSMLSSSLPLSLPSSISSYHHQHHIHHHNNNNNRRYFSSVFGSRHNQSLNVSSTTIIEYCSHHGIIRSGADYKQTNTHVIIKECPFCSKPTNNKASNLYKLHILIGGGAFFCHRCGNGGSWYDFKNILGGGNRYNNITTMMNMNSANMSARNNNKWANQQGGNARYGGNSNGYSNNNNSQQQRQHIGGTDDVRYNNNETVQCLPLPKPRVSGYYSSRLLDPTDEDITTNPKICSNNNTRVLDYLLNVRGIDRKTLRKYGVGKAIYKFSSDDGGGYVEAECVTFPWIMRASDIQQQESLRGATYNVSTNNNDNTNNKAKNDSSTTSATSNNTNETPTGGFVTRRIKARAVDQKAWQRLDPPGGGWGLFGLHTVPDDCTEVVLTEGEYDAMAVSQATGRPAISLPNGCRSLPVQVLPLLERFEKIYLWMDNDAPGQEGAEKNLRRNSV